MSYAQVIYRLIVHKLQVAYYARRYFPWCINRWEALVIFLCHDSDKFLHLPSVKYRFETGEPTDFSEYHIRSQRHHWQYWQWHRGSFLMPKRYIYEMIADWFSASQLETGNAWNALDFAKREIGEMCRQGAYQGTVEYTCDYIRYLRGFTDCAKWYVKLAPKRVK